MVHGLLVVLGGFTGLILHTEYPEDVLICLASGLSAQGVHLPVCKHTMVVWVVPPLALLCKEALLLPVVEEIDRALQGRTWLTDDLVNPTCL